ncbi:MAG: methylated-DNA--[Clostridia bacterium]|nr:methylated-DNA--[protein]-cysteine S-methyltransferase [Clostridia bacterium]
MQYIYYYDSPLGGITLRSDGEALTGLWFDEELGIAEEMKTGVLKKLPVFLETGKWLDIYFQGREPDFTPKLCLKGSPFQMTVWETLLGIPYGRTKTYKNVAEAARERMGALRMSAQAAGGAVGKNPVSIIVPCHRVVGSNGSLTGYAGGLFRKAALLRLEGNDMTRLFMPKER